MKNEPIQPIIPFEPIRAKDIPIGNNWIAQVKWDGVRMLTYYNGHEVKLINRKGNERTQQYPEFTNIKAYCNADSVILDGEMIALQAGKPSFHEIMRRDSLRRAQEIRFAAGRIPAIYMIFDIVYCNGSWVNHRTLTERQRLLTEVILPNEQVQIVPNVSDASSLFTVMKQQEWEGIVCKKLDSTYLPGGKDARWAKVKLAFDMYAVVGGVTFRDGLVNALLLGLYDAGGKLNYIGHAGPGKCSHEDLRSLTGTVRSLAKDKSELTGIPKAKAKGALWLSPRLTVKVQFMEWTPGGTMRHPIIQGLASVPPEDCTLSQNI
ncbi:bifunctional non-homologous end joining protein LigD [Fontibacillus panacisegetis]|uniref:DNA ligase (ATP) n=1 Tax=Fontibacillus panacisegetis TaxID=670482 RepID=A0A1G7QZT7_9BACL|nr:RNA ligase family protein [Fontibacillus panacisegetis]SDG03997.1 bifunctional non-homologous end joining protein LigD [Fontibacillus panacisegetis]